jgi:hypothetical protein
MSDEALKRRVQRLFRTLVIGGAALASQTGCDDKTEAPQHDGGDQHEDAGDDDGGNGPQFW